MTIRSCGFIALAAIIICLPAGTETRSPLPARYQQWLTEEVAYIIAARERDVFLALKTDRERDIFIEAFWKQRDPSPGTERNEFKDEHYRRLEYANTFYGRRHAASRVEDGPRPDLHHLGSAQEYRIL